MYVLQNVKTTISVNKKAQNLHETAYFTSDSLVPQSIPQFIVIQNQNTSYSMSSPLLMGNLLRMAVTS